MKKIIFTLLSWFCIYNPSYGDFSIKDLVFYASNYDKKDGDESVVAYVLKKDPCVTVDTLDGNKKRFCDIKEGMNLETNPSIYVYDLQIVSQVIYFTVAAPWNGQNCTVIAKVNKLKCKPTGR